MIKLFQISIKKQNFGIFDRSYKKLKKYLSAEVQKASKKLALTIRRRHFSGRSAISLRRKTGKLKSTVRPMPVISYGDSVVGGVSMGNESTAHYHNVHIGPQGRVTRIVPRKAQSLAIPLSLRAEQLRDSVPSLRSIPNLERGFGRRRKDILYLNDGTRRIPMFILKQSVSIKARVHPEMIARQNYHDVAAMIKKAVSGAFK